MLPSKILLQNKITLHLTESTDVKSTNNEDEHQRTESKSDDSTSWNGNMRSLPPESVNYRNNSAPAPPLTNTDARIQTVELLSQFGENVQEIVAALSDFHTYWEHR